MWPLGHLVVGYLSYVTLLAWRRDGLPADWRTLAVLAVGTQLPDIIDKPLSYLGVVPSGRSVAHSLIVFAGIVAGVWLLSTAIRDRWPALSGWATGFRYRVPFVVGYISHLLADSYRSLLVGDVWAVRYLVWPLVPAPRFTSDTIAPWVRLLDMTLTPAVAGELVLTAIAGVLFVWLRVRTQ